MKKIACIASLILAMSINLNAQNFGIKVGVGVDNFNGIENEYQMQDYEWSTTYHNVFSASLGMTFDYDINDVFGFSTGIGVAQKGISLTHLERYSNYDQNGNSWYEDAKFDIKLKVAYIEVPLMLKGGVNIGETKVYGIFGGMIGLATFGKNDYTWTIETIGGSKEDAFFYTESESEFGEYSDLEFGVLSQLNVGVMPGIGVEFGSVQIETTYNMGVTNAGDGTINTLSCSLGYKFGK